MANRPCTKAIKCPGPAPGLEADYPVINYSAEYTDGPEFVGWEPPIWNPYDPGQPGWWASEACDGLYRCVSFLSQQDADDCAKRLADLCAETPPPLVSDPCLRDPDSCVDDGNGPPEGPVNPLKFYNSAQSGAFICPDGTLFTYTVAAGTIVSSSQELADQLAAALAQARAAQNFICFSELATQPCLDSGWTGNITVTGANAPFIINLNGGALPPGVTFQVTGSNSFRFIGTPTAAGDYVVSVSALAMDGSIGTKSFAISVLGITNASALPDATLGSAYSEQLVGAGGTPPYTFYLASGTLPDGLTLSSSGLISGTPTTVEFQDVEIGIQDSTP